MRETDANGSRRARDWLWFLSLVALGSYLLWDAFVVHADTGVNMLFDVWSLWLEPALAASALVAAWVLRPWGPQRTGP